MIWLTLYHTNLAYNLFQMLNKSASAFRNEKERKYRYFNQKPTFTQRSESNGDHGTSITETKEY